MRPHGAYDRIDARESPGPIERTTDFPYPSSTLNIRAVNTSFDIIAAWAQQLAELIGRCITQPATEALQIGPLPSAPARANAVLGFDAAGNPVPVSMAPNVLTDTSATVLTIGAGTQSLVVSAGKQFQAGQFILLSSRADSANYMHGTVTSYDAATGALVVNMLDTGGSGSHADWNVSISGAQGPTGPQGAPGAGSGNVTGPAASVAGNVATFTDASGTAIEDSGVAFGTGANNAVQLDSAGRLPAVDGSQLTGLGAVPSGVVVPFAGSSAPAGWLLCYGEAVSRTSYAALYAVIGTTFGSGDGSTTFNLPDLRGRAPFGADSMGGTAANRLGSAVAGGITGSATVGAVGGEQSHTLTQAEMPAHAHSYSVPNATNYLDGSQTGGSEWVGGPNSGSTGSAGSGAAHNNMPPALVLNYIVKA